jgi:hypothetical protein
MSDKLEALIDAAVSRALERVEATVQEKFDTLTAANDALAKKNRQLLREKKLAEGKVEDDRSPAMKAADRILNGEPLRASNEISEVRITRAEARNHAMYREKQALAAKRGVSLKVIDDASSDAAAPTESNVGMFDDPLRGVTYANAKLVREVGITRLKQLARQKGHELRYFVSRQDLPNTAYDLHDEAQSKGGADG